MTHDPTRAMLADFAARSVGLFSKGVQFEGGPGYTVYTDC
jgi:hypothetical protein